MAYTANLQNALSENPGRWFAEIWGSLTAALSDVDFAAVQAALEAQAFPATVAEIAELYTPEHSNTLMKIMVITMQTLSDRLMQPKHD